MGECASGEDDVGSRILQLTGRAVHAGSHERVLVLEDSAGAGEDSIQNSTRGLALHVPQLIGQNRGLYVGRQSRRLHLRNQIN